MQGDVVNVVFCCDGRYSDQLQVAALSVILNTLSKVSIYVVDCGIPEESRDALLVLKGKYVNVADIAFREPVREEAFEKCSAKSQFPPAVFYRLTIPKIFPELSRAIYLDCDVIASDDINLLWSVNLEGRAFGALNDETNFFSSEDIAKRKARIGLSPERIYVSSGVLLIDAKRFEENGIFERVLEFVKNCDKPLPCPAQDAMNLCLSPDEHLPLDPRFNFTPFAPLAGRCLKKFGRPVIIHYSCFKPWAFNRKFVNKLYGLGLFRRSLGFIREYWIYSDQIDGNAFSAKSTKMVWNFLCKQTFGKFEYFVAKKIRNGIIRLWRRMRENEKKKHA